VSIIDKKCREANILAARFYKLAEEDRDRAARDWYLKIKEASELINEEKKCRRHLRQIRIIST
tara:strand:- start:479 stop:667 length:189 start_codon:yes stop_codon:yes gene_type:complete